MRQALIDRNDRPFDPDLYDQVTDKQMLNRQYARGVARRIAAIQTSGETTHLSVMDSEGNAVALTQSIENVYGSCAASPQLGFLYNNYMSAFNLDDPSHPYYLRPNAVPWASVAPTIVFRDERPWLAIGSPGASASPRRSCRCCCDCAGPRRWPRWTRPGSTARSTAWSQPRRRASRPMCLTRSAARASS